MTSPAPTPSGSTAPVNRHVLTPVEKQRMQLDKLLKDPVKPAFIPAPPKEKTLRPAREMMKNVQGSSAGAGSGEFHVYKASRRREYERLKLLEEESTKEIEDAEFEKKRREADELANSKTAKNRAKRQKKKERSKAKGAEKEEEDTRQAAERSGVDAPIKKRRLVNGTELVFKRPGEGSDVESGDEGPQPAAREEQETTSGYTLEERPAILEETRITIIEDD